MDNIYKAVQLTIDSPNLALSKTPTHVYIANQYVDTNDTPLITAPFIIQKALENGTGVVDIVSSTIGSIYEVRLLCDAEVLISGYFYMPPMNAKFSELELYTSYPPRTPPVINEFWQKTENFILEKTNTLLNFVQVFNSLSSMRLSLGYLEELLTDKKHSLVAAINEVYKRYEGVGDLYEKNVEAGAGANGWTTALVKDASGKTQQQINDVSIKNGTYDPVLGSPVKFKLNPLKASLLYGISDPTHLDDSLNNFRGLSSQNAWDDSNIGIGGVAFGRNCVPFAYLSSAFGHDCVAYGVASLVGGAGSATGNPDAPSDGANYGYCSFAWGKDTIALGRISTAFGQTNVAGTVHSFASGYESKTGKGSSAHPVLSGTAVDDDGDCAFVHGYRAFAYGNYSLAFGNFVRAYHGSKVIGSGINPGSLLEALVPNSLVLGSGVDVPTIILTSGDTVENNAFGKVGFNTKYKPRERVEVVLKDGDKIAIRSSNNTPQGGGSIDLQGTLNNGNSASIFRIEYTSPNAGQAYGTTNFYQNNQNWLSLNESGDPTFKKPVNSLFGYYVNGVRVLGGQQSAIENSTGTTADNQRAINAILAALRRHGLIAS